MNDEKFITVSEKHYEEMSKFALNGAIRVNELEAALYMIIGFYQNFTHSTEFRDERVNVWMDRVKEKAITHPVLFQSEFSYLNGIKI